MLDDYIDTVKRLHDMYLRSANTEDDRARQNALSWASRCKSLMDYLVDQKRLLTPVPSDLGDVSDLPEALIKELGIVRPDELEQQIMTLMRANKGASTLDQILVGLFRKFKVTQTRRFLQNKLYRMSKRNFVFQIPDERGLFDLHKEHRPKPVDDDDIPF